MNLQTVKTWLAVASFLGFPRIVWASLTLLVLLDVVCAHSKNPRINHFASALGLLVRKIVEMVGIGKIPLLGPALLGVLDALIGPAVVADVVTGKPVVVNPPAPPTEPAA